MDRRVDLQHCWFLGPIVISLGTMAKNGGVALPWFERMVTNDAPPQELGVRAIPVESVNHLFKSVEARLGSSAIADMGRGRGTRPNFSAFIALG